MVAARTFALVVFAAAVFGFVVYVWNLDHDPAPYVPRYPTTTTASTLPTFP